MHAVVRILSVLLIAGTWAGWEVLERLTPQGATTSQEPFSALAAPAPSNDRDAWAVDFLARLGNAQPTGETVAFLEAWHRAEGGTAAFNWLNTTQGAAGDTCYNYINGACGVRNYPDYATGIQATVETLQNGYYPRTLAGLVSNQPVIDDGEMGTWGTGGGAVRAQMEATQVEYAPRVSSKCGYTDTMAVGENSSFYSTGAPAWSGQYGGMHLGADMIGNPGDPVYAPWEMMIDSVGRYDDPGRYGAFIQAHIVSDGYLFYAGHLIDVYVASGQRVPACTVIGTLGATSQPHTHIKMGSPSAPVPCEGAQPGPNGCIDPIEYWETH